MTRKRAKPNAKNKAQTKSAEGKARAAKPFGSVKVGAKNAANAFKKGAKAAGAKNTKKAVKSVKKHTTKQLAKVKAKSNAKRKGK